MDNVFIERNDDKFELGINFYKENVNKLISQCKTNNNAASYLYTYSFLEGYFRARFPSKFEFKKNSMVSFPMMADAFIKYNESLSYKGKSEAVLLLIDIKYLYGHWDKNEWSSSENTDANHIRHCFADIKTGELYCLLKRICDFFSSQSIDTILIKELLQDSSIFEDKVATKFLNYFCGAQEDFFWKYQDFARYIRYKEILNSSLADYVKNEQHDKIFYGKRYETYKNYSSSVEQNEKIYLPYENYYNCLRTSLDQEITGRNYEKELQNGFKLNNQQRQIVDECYESLMNKKNIIIEGAPGTGKTLLLISALFVLNKKHEGKPLLVTFSSSLEKYNEYLCKVFNDDGFLDQFNIKQYKKESVSDFVGHHVQSYYGWICKTLHQYLKQAIYPINKIDKSSLELKNKELNFITDKDYERLTTEIWPNLMNLDPVNDKHLIAFHKILDAQKKVPDLYAFWKFAKNFDAEELQRASTNRPDFILLDEVQDLTKAQFQTAQKISAKGCILAGDINQSIKNTCSSWKDLGIEKNDDNIFIELKHNFRMSYNIEKFGRNYLNLCNKKTIDLTPITGTEISGPSPQLYVKQANQTESIYTQITNSVRMLVEVCKKQFKHIFIVATTNDEVNEIEKSLKIYQKERPFKIEKLKERDIDNIDYEKEYVIHLGTIEAIKGIDCPIVLLLVTNNILTKPNIQNSLYSVINRAMHLLQVFMPVETTKNQNEFIKNFVSLLRSGNQNSETIPKYWQKFHPEKVIKLRDQNQTVILAGKLEDGSDGSIKEQFLLDRLSLTANEAKEHKEIIVTIYGKGDKGYYLSPEYITVKQ